MGIRPRTSRWRPCHFQFIVRQLPEKIVIRIDEWTPLFPNIGEVSARLRRASANEASNTSDLIGRIFDRLAKMGPPGPPAAAQLFLDEGLRWIRVGFKGVGPLEPLSVEIVGKVIASCVPRGEKLYFHALRPYDLLFFLEGGDVDSIGAPPKDYGMPLADVLTAWRIKS